MSDSASTATALVVVPDHETVTDLLYFDAIAQTVAALIDATSDKPLTVGIHGDWGAGKSSILRMVEARYKEKAGTLCLHFDGWRFQGFDDAKTALLETIVEELRDSETYGSKIKKQAKKLLKRIRWMKVARRGGQLLWNFATGLPSPEQVTDVLGKLSDLVSHPQELLDVEAAKRTLEEVKGFVDDPEAEKETAVSHIRAFQKEFEELLDAAGVKKLVVLIDDLDRCLPKTAIETLEAIRLFLFTPQTAFVIATDEAMVEYAVRQHFPDLPAAAGPTTYARNYLEKLIQIPFRIPALGIEEAKVYVTLLLAQSILGETDAGFKKLIEKARAVIRTPWISNTLTLDDLKAAAPAKQAELTAAYRLAQQLGSSVADGLDGNPRQIKRFLNAVALRKAVADARDLSKEVELPVLARVMLIERFKPEFYSKVVKTAMAAPGGLVRELKLLETDIAPGAADKSLADGKREGEPRHEALADEDWLKDEWLRSWARLDPDRPLSKVDLRPYVFATRDKKRVGRSTSTGGMDKILAAVGSGALGVTQVEGDIRDLSEPDVRFLFATLSDQILATEKLTAAPPAFQGLCAVVRHHSNLQGQIVSFLDDLPENELGGWAAAGWQPHTFEETAKAKARELLTKWESKGGKQLQIVARATLKKLSEAAAR